MLSQLDEIESALIKMSSKLLPLACEQVPIQSAYGRVLAQPVYAKRDSPAVNVAAMDGFAVCLKELPLILAENFGRVPLSSTARAGHSAPELAPMSALQIFTGACVPERADCIIQREATRESPGFFELQVDLDDLKPGQNIRYRAENIRQGDRVLPAGTRIDMGNIGSLVTFGDRLITVHQQLSIGLLNSGDELVPAGEKLLPWQIHDSNGPTLQSWISQLPWATVCSRQSIADDPAMIQSKLGEAIESSDVVLLTGGVSAGDTDFVPRVIEALGGQIIFHRLPLRPGKPVLGAIIQGKAVIGLPGNPVSTAVTARVIAEPILERLAGCIGQRSVRLKLDRPVNKSLPLWWFRLIQVDGDRAKLVDNRGSGDLVAMGLSDGFIEQPPAVTGEGPWRVWLWSH